MTRKRGLLDLLLGTRSKTYKLGRFLGDAQAVTKGATGIGKRLVRKSAYKALSKTLRRLGL